jgi:putative ABC transport system substrate-binding protein
LKKGLAQAGYVGGRNVAIEYRFADGSYERLPALAADLVNRRVALIFASGIPAARAAKAATASIPIVFGFGEDPVREGIVASFNRPGGNITGFSWLSNQLIGKRVGLLGETVPAAKVFAILVDPRNPIFEPDTNEARVATSALGRSLEVFNASSEREVEAAFPAMVQRGTGALIVDEAPYFIERVDQLVALAARHRIPAIYGRRLFVEAGGLMSYSADQEDAWRQCGGYIGRILRGEKPGDLPIQQSTKIEFVINLKTAKSIGLTIPPTVVGPGNQRRCRTFLSVSRRPTP